MSALTDLGKRAAKRTVSIFFDYCILLFCSLMSDKFVPHFVPFWLTFACCYALFYFTC